ncbi:hypothetical protein HaLaN_17474, partial [Haematococcus lacustris]
MWRRLNFRGTQPCHVMMPILVKACSMASTSVKPRGLRTINTSSYKLPHLCQHNQPAQAELTAA